MPVFKLSDSGGSYTWIFEAYTDEQMRSVSDDEIAAEVDFHLEVAKAEYIASLSEGAEDRDYPRWGYSSADRLENAEEYEAYYRSFMEDEITEEREAAIKAGIERREEIREESRKFYDLRPSVYIAFRRTLTGDPDVWEGLVEKLAPYEVLLIDNNGEQALADLPYQVDGLVVWGEFHSVLDIKSRVDAWLQEHGYGNF